MKKFNLPVDYTELTSYQKRAVREQYIEEQEGLCMFCGQPLSSHPPKEVKSKPINWKLFPPGFLRNPVHLQHNHSTGMTEGAVHAYCNAVMWQYYGR